MCIDFTDVNDAFLKDSYPTPPVDRLVDSTMRDARLSFVDAYRWDISLHLNAVRTKKCWSLILKGNGSGF